MLSFHRDVCHTGIVDPVRFSMKTFSEPAAEAVGAEPLKLGLLVCLQIRSVLCRSWRPVRLELRKASKVTQRNCSTSSRVTCSRPCWVRSFYTTPTCYHSNASPRSDQGSCSGLSRSGAGPGPGFAVCPQILTYQPRLVVFNVNESTHLSTYTDKNLCNLRC